MEVGLWRLLNHEDRPGRQQFAFFAMFSLTKRNLAVVEIEYKVPSTHYGISPDIATVGL
jgi:hypothetical protein